MQLPNDSAFEGAAPSEDGPTQLPTAVVQWFPDKVSVGRRDPTLLLQCENHNLVTRLAFELVQLPALLVGYTGHLGVKGIKETTEARVGCMSSPDPEHISLQVEACAAGCPL